LGPRELNEARKKRSITKEQKDPSQRKKASGGWALHLSRVPSSGSSSGERWKYMLKKEGRRKKRTRRKEAGTINIYKTNHAYPTVYSWGPRE